MKIRLLHPITHDGIHFSRGIHDLDDATAEVLLGVHSVDCTSYEAKTKDSPEKPEGECRNHPAVHFVEQNPVMGTATAAPDAKKDKLDLSKAPPEAKIPEPPAPDSSGPGKATAAPDAGPKNGKKKE